MFGFLLGVIVGGGAVWGYYSPSSTASTLRGMVKVLKARMSRART